LSCVHRGRTSPPPPWGALWWYLCGRGVWAGFPAEANASNPDARPDRSRHAASRPSGVRRPVLGDQRSEPLASLQELEDGRRRGRGSRGLHARSSGGRANAQAREKPMKWFDARTAVRRAERGAEALEPPSHSRGTSCGSRCGAATPSSWPHWRVGRAGTPATRIGTGPRRPRQLAHAGPDLPRCVAGNRTARAMRPIPRSRQRAYPGASHWQRERRYWTKSWCGSPPPSFHPPPLTTAPARADRNPRAHMHPFRAMVRVPSTQPTGYSGGTVGQPGRRAAERIERVTGRGQAKRRARRSRKARSRRSVLNSSSSE